MIFFSCYLALHKEYIVCAGNDCFDPDNPCGNKLLDDGMISFIVADNLRWSFIES
ncbi:hypothetical protein [Clostridium sartagoforme]|uniref:hypothetical protein n=1 Tax=Clostridium sartagoforme TaxID=84031 RepID=UPI0014412A03|nr:hypothetical protein [Clostridium sartagoforme]